MDPNDEIEQESPTVISPSNRGQRMRDVRKQIRRIGRSLRTPLDRFRSRFREPQVAAEVPSEAVVEVEESSEPLRPRFRMQNVGRRIRRFGHMLNRPLQRFRRRFRKPEEEVGKEPETPEEPSVASQVNINRRGRFQNIGTRFGARFRRIGHKIGQTFGRLRRGSRTEPVIPIPVEQGTEQSPNLESSFIPAAERRVSFAQHALPQPDSYTLKRLQRLSLADQTSFRELIEEKQEECRDCIRLIEEIVNEMNRLLEYAISNAPKYDDYTMVMIIHSTNTLTDTIETIGANLLQVKNFVNEVEFESRNSEEMIYSKTNKWAFQIQQLEPNFRNLKNMINETKVRLSQTLGNLVNEEEPDVE